MGFHPVPRSPLASRGQPPARGRAAGGVAQREQDMIWIRFDESDHRIPAPFFCLPGVISGQANGQICIQDYHEQGSLALFFTHSSGCSACLQALQTFARRQEDYREQETKILAVFPETPEKLAGNSRPGSPAIPTALRPGKQGSPGFYRADGRRPGSAGCLPVVRAGSLPCPIRSSDRKRDRRANGVETQPPRPISSPGTTYRRIS